MTIVDLTADQLLNINNPEKLFTNDFDAAKREFHILSMKWYPERNPDPIAKDVFIHIKTLYETAKLRIGTVCWNASNTLFLNLKNGKILSRPFHVKHNFELGEFYIGDSYVAYIVKSEFKDFFDNGISVIKSLKYRDKSMQRQIAPCMPDIETILEAEQGHVLVVRKEADVFLLRDLMNHLGVINEKHTAWIYGRLINLCCFLHHVTYITHNGLNPDTIFINPKEHRAVLLGGWWYASKHSSHHNPPIGKLIGLPNYTISHGWPSILRTKAPDYRNDLTLIKAIARELLGDINGIRLQRSSTLPKQFVNWFTTKTSGKAVTDYEQWENARDSSLGPRKFVELLVTRNDLYPESKGI